MSANNTPNDALNLVQNAQTPIYISGRTFNALDDQPASIEVAGIIDKYHNEIASFDPMLEGRILASSTAVSVPTEDAQSLVLSYTSLL